MATKDTQNKYPIDTPWGRVDIATKHRDGLWFLSTTSHGGFWLSDERIRDLPVEMRGTSFVDRSGGLTRDWNNKRWTPNAWWEEDCDAVKIARVFKIA